MNNKPSMGRIVKYRGKFGRKLMRSAFVTCTIDDLDYDGVAAGEIPDLDSDMHVHLNVATPSTMMWFPEFNVSFGVPGEDGMIPPGTWAWPIIK